MSNGGYSKSKMRILINNIKVDSITILFPLFTRYCIFHGTGAQFHLLLFDFFNLLGCSCTTYLNFPHKIQLTHSVPTRLTSSLATRDAGSGTECVNREEILQRTHLLVCLIYSILTCMAA